jgi:hypothetical protein
MISAFAVVSLSYDGSSEPVPSTLSGRQPTVKLRQRAEDTDHRLRGGVPRLDAFGPTTAPAARPSRGELTFKPPVRPSGAMSSATPTSPRSSMILRGKGKSFHGTRASREGSQHNLAANGRLRFGLGSNQAASRDCGRR